MLSSVRQVGCLFRGRLRLGRLEADFFTNGVGQGAQDAVVFEEDGFDPSKSFVGFFLELRHLIRDLDGSFIGFGLLCDKSRLSLDHDGLGLNERRERLIQFPIALLYRARHVIHSTLLSCFYYIPSV